jgi:hypothetical protein
MEDPGEWILFAGAMPEDEDLTEVAQRMDVLPPVQQHACETCGEASKEPVCRVCKQPATNEPRWNLVPIGCGCGTFVHVPCAMNRIAVKKHRKAKHAYDSCSKCQRGFGIQLSIELARARHAIARNLPAISAERQQAEIFLITTLRRSGDYATALPLCQSLLATQRVAHGSTSPETQAAAATLGGLYVDMGRLDAAEPLLSDVLEVGASVNAPLLHPSKLVLA